MSPNNAKAKTSTGTLTRAPVAGTDEERDWSAYRAYLRDLTPEGLWDAYTHIDPDDFPRRREAIEREMNRRGLFYVSPYTDLEQKARLLHVNMVAFALLAFVLHHIPTATAAINRLQTGLNNGAPLLSPSGQAVALVSGLTIRETKVLHELTLLFGGLAALLLLASVILLPYLMLRLHRRALRPDVLMLSVVASGIAALLLGALR